jgi:hypothetical protein
MDSTFDYEVALFSVPFYLPFDPEEYKIFFSEVIRTLKPSGKAYFNLIFKNAALDKSNGFREDIFIPSSFMHGVLSEFSNLISYKVEQVDIKDLECRLVITKNE